MFHFFFNKTNFEKMKEKINGGGQKRGGVAKCNTALSDHLQEHMIRVITTPVKLRKQE